MADITAQILMEIRDEARDAHAETRENFKTVFHLLTLVENRLAQVETMLGLVETGANDLKQSGASGSTEMAHNIAHERPTEPSQTC